MISDEQLATFRETGHVTVPAVLTPQQVSDALTDIETWSAVFLAELGADKKQWYLEDGGSTPMLRKLDNPAYHRSCFQTLAAQPAVVTKVEQLIGPGVSVFFSQVFCKPPEVGGPKPVHQDNFYFGPQDLNATLTVWIALDDATVENGCLFYGDGSNKGPVYAHTAPEGQPFNLQVAAEHVGIFEMTPAPVPSGGISFHHGNTWHQSSSNNSNKARRAVVFHYLRNDAKLVTPALQYDPAIIVRITD